MPTIETMSSKIISIPITGQPKRMTEAELEKIREMASKFQGLQVLKPSDFKYVLT